MTERTDTRCDLQLTPCDRGYLVRIHRYDGFVGGGQWAFNSIHEVATFLRNRFETSDSEVSK